MEDEGGPMVRVMFPFTVVARFIHSPDKDVAFIGGKTYIGQVIETSNYGGPYTVVRIMRDGKPCALIVRPHMADVQPL